LLLILFEKGLNIFHTSQFLISLNRFSVGEFVLTVDIPEEEQMRLLEEYEHECKTRRPSNGQKPTENQRKLEETPSLPLEENHYSEIDRGRKDTSEDSEGQSVTSLLDSARDRIFSLVKSAMDSLELTETEEKAESEVKPEAEADDEKVIDRLVVKERADMVIVGASSPPTSDSCSNDKGKLSNFTRNYSIANRRLFES